MEEKGKAWMSCGDIVVNYVGMHLVQMLNECKGVYIEDINVLLCLNVFGRD